MNDILAATETPRSPLTRFSDPAQIFSIGVSRIVKLLSPFTAELAASGLAVPEPSTVDDTYAAGVIALLTNPSCPAALLDILLTLETAARPENTRHIDDAITRRVPNVSLSSDPIDRVLELFFVCPEELASFQGPKSSAFRSLGEGRSSLAAPNQSVAGNLHGGCGRAATASITGLSEANSALPLISSLQNSNTPPLQTASPPLSDPQSAIPDSSLEVPSSLDISHSSLPSSLHSSEFVVSPPPVAQLPAGHPEHGAAVASVLDSISATLSRFVILPPHAADTLALWVLHTYAYELRDVSTYIGIESPEKRCGKTTLLSVLAELTSRPIVASNISSSAFFRVIQETRPTLLIDEADTFLQTNDEFRGILNSGYTRKTAFVIRVANDPKDSPSPAFRSLGEGRSSRAAKGDATASNLDLSTYPLGNVSTPKSGLRHFSVWCPKAMAAIGRLPDTLADRCIVIRMQRKTRTEQCERLRSLDGSDIRKQCQELVGALADSIVAAQPAIPKELNDRAADLWEPMLILADLAGRDWPDRARKAALALSTAAQDHSSIGSLLLDLVLLFTTLPDQKKFFTRDLLDYLTGLGNRPWSILAKGKPITDLWLSAQLRPYGIAPKSIWINGHSSKGYSTDQFDDVFKRYIPRSEIEAKKAELNEIWRQQRENQNAVPPQPAKQAA